MRRSRLPWFGCSLWLLGAILGVSMQKEGTDWAENEDLISTSLIVGKLTLVPIGEMLESFPEDETLNDMKTTFSCSRKDLGSLQSRNRLVKQNYFHNCFENMPIQNGQNWRKFIVSLVLLLAVREYQKLGNRRLIYFPWKPLLIAMRSSLILHQNVKVLATAPEVYMFFMLNIVRVFELNPKVNSSYCTCQVHLLQFHWRQ